MDDCRHDWQHRVVVVAYDGLCTFEFGIAVEAFGLPRPDFDFPWYDFRVASIEPQIRAVGGFTMQTEGGIELLDHAEDQDMVVGARTKGDVQIPLIRRPAKAFLRCWA